MQIYANMAVLLIHSVDQNWFEPVVCNLKAITGEALQVKSCQSQDERRAALMSLRSPSGKWILHTKHTKPGLPTSAMMGYKPQLIDEDSLLL